MNTERALYSGIWYDITEGHLNQTDEQKIAAGNLKFHRLKMKEFEENERDRQLREDRARNSPINTTAQRDSLAPNAIERAAISIFGTQGSNLISNDHGSIGELRPSADEDSCGGGDTTTRKWQPLHVETQTRISDEFVKPQGISTLLPVRKNGISIVQKPDEWIEIEITVDSGACVTVMPRSLCPGISILQNRLSREGVEYEVANGAHIPNLGERRCELMTIGSGVKKLMTFQVADVHKALLSVTDCADMGFDCYLGAASGHLIDRVSGERIPLERRENLYIMRAWIRQDPTVQVSQPFVGPG